MKVIEYFASSRKEHWLGKLEECDWSAGRHLHRLLKDGTFFNLLGKDSKLFMLTDRDELISFCTLSEADDIRPADLTPWMGFVYTYPPYRGHRYTELLMREIERKLWKEHVPAFYISTDHEGLYEKYGCKFLRVMDDVKGNPSKVYIRKVNDPFSGRKTPRDFTADGALTYGVKVGRFTFEEDRTIIFALSDFPRIAASDSFMFYQISEKDHDDLLAMSGSCPAISAEMTVPYRREFLCGESAHCKRNSFTLEDADLSLAEYY